MSDTKHTPGPWTFRNNSFLRPEILYETGILASISTPHDPASPPSKWSECTANARLIAAAPDMLAALKYYKDECSGAEPSISVFQRMVDEAIAKAQS